MEHFELKHILYRKWTSHFHITLDIKWPNHMHNSSQVVQEKRWMAVLQGMQVLGNYKHNPSAVQQSVSWQNLFSVKDTCWIQCLMTLIQILLLEKMLKRKKIMYVIGKPPPSRCLPVLSSVLLVNTYGGWFWPACTWLVPLQLSIQIIIVHGQVTDICQVFTLF